ncbi:MAG: arsenate reductase (glutaredoxin) [Actinomycetota bacterium]
MSVKIFFNPECSKCRGTLELLRAQGVEPEIVRYLDEPPNEDELREILSLLGVGPRALVRVDEPLYEAQKLDDADDAALIAAMVANPILIQRPIVIANGRAEIGRPPERVLSIL